MTYTHEDVERLLSYAFNGGRWRRPDAPDDDMPRAKGNPAHQGTEMAETLDIKRAYWALIEAEELQDPLALWGYYGEDLPQRAIAEAVGLTQQAVSLHLFRDVERLVTAINEGRRPRTREYKELA